MELRIPAGLDEKKLLTHGVVSIITRDFLSGRYFLQGLAYKDSSYPNLHFKELRVRGAAVVYSHRSIIRTTWIHRYLSIVDGHIDVKRHIQSVHDVVYSFALIAYYKIISIFYNKSLRF